MMRASAPLVLGCIAALSACSGGETPTGVITPGAYADALALFSTQEDAHDAFAATAAFTDPSALPTVGTATYTGYVTLSDGAGYALAGNAEIIANWDCCEITGAISNLITQDDEVLSGQFDILHGEIDMDGDPNAAPIVVADVIGTLSGGAGDHVSDEFDPLILQGNFVGDAYEWFAGSIEGPITAPDGTHTLDGNVFADR